MTDDVRHFRVELLGWDSPAAMTVASHDEASAHGYAVSVWSSQMLAAATRVTEVDAEGRPVDVRV